MIRALFLPGNFPSTIGENNKESWLIKSKHFSDSLRQELDGFGCSQISNWLNLSSFGKCWKNHSCFYSKKCRFSRGKKHKRIQSLASIIELFTILFFSLLYQKQFWIFFPFNNRQKQRRKLFFTLSLCILKRRHFFWCLNPQKNFVIKMIVPRDGKRNLIFIFFLSSHSCSSLSGKSSLIEPVAQIHKILKNSDWTHKKKNQWKNKFNLKFLVYFSQLSIKF